MEVLLVIVGIVVALFFIAIVIDGVQRDNARFKPGDYTGPPPPVKRGRIYQDDRGRDRCYMCNKVVFYSETDASTASDKAMTRRNTYLRTYFESKCRYWHLTSKRPRVRF